MAIAAVRVQLPSRVRIRGKVSTAGAGFFGFSAEPSSLERRLGKQKSAARAAGRFFHFQHVRAGLTPARKSGGSSRRRTYVPPFLRDSPSQRRGNPRHCPSCFCLYSGREKAQLFSSFNLFGRDSPYPKYAEITIRVFLIFFPCRARNFSRHHFSHPNCFPWVSYL